MPRWFEEVLIMGSKDKGGREAKKPKAKKNIKVGGQTPTPLDSIKQKPTSSE